MARSVLEEICKDYGYEKNDKGRDMRLFQKIDAMHDDGAITKRLKISAHATRELGNDMAHGDFATSKPEPEDADAVLALMSMFIDQLYVQDARTQRLIDRQKGEEEPGLDVTRAALHASGGVEARDSPSESWKATRAHRATSERNEGRLAGVVFHERYAANNPRAE